MWLASLGKGPVFYFARDALHGQSDARAMAQSQPGDYGGGAATRLGPGAGRGGVVVSRGSMGRWTGQSAIFQRVSDGSGTLGDRWPRGQRARKTVGAVGKQLGRWG